MGIYGVLARAVAQRTRETGVRVAIGAARRQVVRMILRGGFTVAASGIASVWSPRLRSARYSKRRVTACDPVTYVVVGATLAAVALLACNVPAVRATRIDPLLALRCD